MLSGYHIIETLYESTRTIVYRGRQTADNKLVILKILRYDYPTAEQLARFRREFELTSRFNDNGIIKAYRLENYQDSLVMVLEDGCGQSLAKLLSTTPLTITDFLQIALQLIDSLAIIHHQNVIHKDINPTNIIVALASEVNSDVRRLSKWQVKIIDFGISTSLAREETSAGPTFLEGTMAYMSPEQTGRMNRRLDYRADFYSLGATFYEMLVGHPPFRETDPMALMHSHIAKIPPSPAALKPTIPVVLSDIVMKLLAKTAEERYQSAAGLRTDLQQCWQQWQADQQIEPFPLAQQDISDKFQISQKLYGREKDVAQLMAAFERIITPSEPANTPTILTKPQRTELVLVTGQSGIGKSMLINEIDKPLAQHRGYFATGKFDQYKRNVPYLSLMQAFQGVVRQLLTFSHADIERWREKILLALGTNGQLIITVIPEVELIIGPQPTPPELPAAEAQDRFRLIFQEFVRLFAQADHPLVIFLDDLQWADSASLKLLHIICTDPETQYLFIVGAYRDDEVDPAHPLMLTLDELRQAGINLTFIGLAPLQLADVTALISDSLFCNHQQAETLAEIVLQKTGGNPFFINQFLQSFYEDKFIQFNSSTGWQWDVVQIRTISLVSDVLDLVIHKIKKLPTATQQVLKLAACLGNQFEVTVLMAVSQQSLADTRAALWPAVEEGLVVPLSELRLMEASHSTEATVWGYRFLHDRIQQAAYSIIPVEERPAFHYRIGHLWLAAIDLEARPDQVFDVVNQLNSGRMLIDQAPERHRLAQLNLLAAQRAKAAAAYGATLKYLTAGIILLTDACWQTEYELAFQLYRERAECEYLTGNFEAAELFFQEIFHHCQTNLERADIYTIKMILYRTLGRHRQVVQLAQEALSLFDIELPGDESLTQVAEQERRRMWAYLEAINSAQPQRAIAGLGQRPVMSDPNQQAVVNILINLISSAFLLNYDLYCFIGFTMVNLAIEYGNAPGSAYGYSITGAATGAKYQDYQAGYEFGKLGLAVSEKFNQFQARTYMVFGLGINAWVAHLRTDVTYGRRTYQYGLETGEFYYAAWGVFVLIRAMVMQGSSLNDIYVEAEKYLDFLERTIYELKPALIGTQQMALALQGATQATGSFSDEGLDEAELVSRMQTNQMKPPLNWYYMLKAQTLYILEDYAAALQIITESAKIIGVSFSLVQTTHHYFYYSLIITALYPTVEAPQQRQWWDMLRDHLAKFKQWATDCPENFAHQQFLLEAEMARLAGDQLTAMTLYDQAIDAAHQNGFIQNEALANELTAKFYLQHGFKTNAATYLNKARYGYTRWGARAKVELLVEQYGNLLPMAYASPYETTVTHTTSQATVQGEMLSSLDMATVMKMSQAISEEMLLGNLLQKLMQLVLENAGAERGYLILNSGGHLTIEAEAIGSGEDVTVLQSLPLNAPDLSPEEMVLPVTIVNYVARVKDDMVLANATREGMFITDPYIIAYQTKSVLCLPLLKQRVLVGVLYLENNLTEGAFTSNHLQILRLLSAQMAISIENAQLYTTLTNNEKKYRTLFEGSRDAIFMTTPEGQIIDVNPAGLHLFGYTSAEIKRITAHEWFFDPADRLAVVQAIIQQGSVRDLEVRYRKKDNTPMDCLLTATVRRAEDGSIVALQGIIRDITERKRAEQERLQLQAENLRLLTEVDVTRDLQYMLLPRPEELTQVAGLEIAGFMEPAEEVGGDYYDVLQYQNQVKIGVGDVTGHGLDSGILMLMTQTAVRTLLTHEEKDPQRFLATLNRVIHDNVRRMEGEKSLTLVLLDYTLLRSSDGRAGDRGHLRLIGQHEELIVVRRDGLVELVDTFDLGFPVGLEADISPFLDEMVIELQPGDGMVLYTDGITEAENSIGEQYGLARLCRVVSRYWSKSAEEIKEIIIDDVREHIGNHKIYDDLTLVILKQQ